MTEIFLGNPPANIIDWIEKHSQPAAAPSPYFKYDSNRVITGLYQGSPNNYVERVNHMEETEQGYEYTGSDVTDSYALGIAAGAFNSMYWAYYAINVGVSGSLNFPNITSIGDEAFCNCSLTSITIGSNIETIGHAAFDTWINPITLTIDKPISWVETRYSDWGLPSGSTIVCTDDTIPIN